MGKRGPRPTPRATLAARGSRKAKARQGEPEPISGVPIKPDWLGDVASAKWDEVVPLLASRGLMAVEYGDFVAMYCLAHQDLIDALKIIASEGMTCTSEKGGEYLHPAVAIKQNAIGRIKTFGDAFGFSASSIRDVTKVISKTQKAGLSGDARKR